MTNIKKISIEEIMDYFSQLCDCSRDRVFVFETNSGYNVLCKCTPVTFDQQQDLTKRVAGEKKKNPIGALIVKLVYIVSS